ncbi:hypothetical protein [Pseudomonas sp. AKS31]|uniref:hypothetical protein n=1 Tax=Pseudomonas sp. AKS31 TaxID=2949091 RepID=UPI00202A151E|nr:hypothetical protein [Pseudomonas sp. AKS31]MCL9802955.1 hypothetical protein [Pseudomonas sp. AKS31]
MEEADRECLSIDSKNPPKRVFEDPAIKQGRIDLTRHPLPPSKKMPEKITAHEKAQSFQIGLSH